MVFEHIDSPTALWLQRHNPALREALAWIRALPPTPEEGITELRGPAMYVNIHGYPTKPAAECRWESHRRTIDLQYCIGGGEIIEWLPAGRLPPLADFNEEKDVEHWQPAGAAPTLLRMEPGTFALFLPGELHRPKVTDGTNPAVRKLVVKIFAQLLDV